MEIFFAYARSLKRERQKLQQKVQAAFPSKEKNLKSSSGAPRSAMIESLRLASVCQNSEH